MAIKEIRVCDVTGEPGAEKTVISVGGREWIVDLTDGSVKQLLEAIRPWTDAGVEQVWDDDLTAATPVSAPPTASGGATGEAVADPAVGLDAAERASCRAWAQQAPQKVLNRHGITERPANRGTLSPKVTRAWVAEGRPAAA